jgi:hypothetical protein
LHERIVEDSFRRDRYGHLLDEQTLPARPPWRDSDRRTVWVALRNAQAHFQRSKDEGERKGLLIDFTRLVRTMHGARWRPEQFNYLTPDYSWRAVLQRAIELAGAEFASGGGSSPLAAR